MQEVRSRRAPHVVLRAVPKDCSSEPVLSDAALIEGILRGDERIAAQLYRRLVSIVDRTLYRVFGRRESDHDDLVQSALEQVVLTLSARRFAGACSLNTWASTIASHVGLAALRARRRERRILAREHDLDAAPVAVGARRPRPDRARAQPPGGHGSQEGGSLGFARRAGPRAGGDRRHDRNLDRRCPIAPGASAARARGEDAKRGGTS